MRVRVVTGAVAVALLAITTAACGGSDARETSENGRTSIKIAVVPSIDAASLVLGKDKGFFAQEGLDVETTQAASGPAGVAAVVSGSVDLGLSANVAILQARAKNVPVVAVAPAAGTSAHPDQSKDKVVVRADSGITSYKQLSGKTVAVVAVKNAPELFVRELIDADGGTSATTQFMGIPFADMATALTSERVDAVAINEPFLSALTAGPGMRSLGSYIDDVLGANTSYTYWFTSSSFAEQKPDTAAAFQRAMKKSAQYADAHPDEVRAVLSKVTKIKEGAAAKVALPQFDNPLDPTAFQRTADLMRKYGFIDGEVAVTDVIFQA